MRVNLLVGFFLLPTLSAGFATSIYGQGDTTRAQTLDTITVTGRLDDLIGIAATASEGRVGSTDLHLRPISREAELLETVPGLIATQHAVMARPTSISSAASTSTTAPTSRPDWRACRSTCPPTPTVGAIPT
jgi:hypothetical protein